MPNGLTALSISEGLAMLNRRRADTAAVAAVARTGYFERLARIEDCRRDPSAECLEQVFMSFAPAMWIDLREEVSSQIYLNYCYEPELTSFILRTLKPGETFVDVGAHFGYFSLVAAQAVGPGGHVLALEPMTHTYRFLERNLDGLDMAQPVQVAAWGESAKLKFHYYGPALSAFSSIGEARLDPSNLKKPALVSVEGVTLDTLLVERGFAPDIVKIDAENSEQNVLDGMVKTIDRCHPTITVEVGDLGDRTEVGRSSRDLLLGLIDQGYTLYDPGFDRDTEHVLKGFGEYTYANVVAIHPLRGP